MSTTTQNKIAGNVSGDDDSDLPEGWAVASILDLCQMIRGVSYKSGEEINAEEKGFIPMLRANNIDGGVVLRDLRFVPS
jgi:type I restriction enzyme S subunit